MLLGDTKSTQSGGLVDGENSEDDEDEGRQEAYETKKIFTYKTVTIA